MSTDGDITYSLLIHGNHICRYYTLMIDGDESWLWNHGYGVMVTVESRLWNPVKRREHICFWCILELFTAVTTAADAADATEIVSSIVARTPLGSCSRARGQDGLS